MNMNDNELMRAWSEPLLMAQRHTFQEIPEGWLASLDSFPMSYGETQRVAVTWTFIMCHKSAYE